MLNIAVQAARKAGKHFWQAYNRLDTLEIHEKANGDLVTSLDKTSEHTIMEIIRKHHPHHPIVSEETPWTDPIDPETPTWIIDPLDGTRNFVHGHPHVAISIAVRIKQAIEVALIYDPFRDELFTAVRGRGAQKDGQRMRINRAPPALDQAVVGIGLSRTYCPPLITQCGAIRSSGSACLDWAYVACGRLDAAVHHQLQIWDVAAGLLIVQEAGGLCANFQGQADWGTLLQGEVAAAPSKLLGSILPLCAVSARNSPNG